MVITFIKIRVMTQEERQLLLIDLSARLPYEVIVQVKDWTILDTELKTGHIQLLQNNNIELKPYLRPMSSMTEEESNELESITFPLMKKDWDGNENPACIRWIDIPKYMDFILSHHFDYQGLIENGLAIEVTEDNNPYKD